VDETFCLFNSEQDATLFFNYITTQHPIIHFTMEGETGHVLPFFNRCPNQQHWPTPHFDLCLREKNISWFAFHLLCGFLPLHLKIGINSVRNYVPINPLTAEWALRALKDFTLSNARRFYLSMGNPLAGKGFIVATIIYYIVNIVACSCAQFSLLLS